MRQTHKQLEKKGWLRQFVANEAQAKDAMEIYDFLGYEVHLQPPNQSHSRKNNSSSPKESRGQCQIVYIRPKSGRMMRRDKGRSGKEREVAKEMAIEKR